MFKGCGWDEDQGWCDVAPGCMEAQDAEADRRYDGWDSCVAPHVAEDHRAQVGDSVGHSRQGTG